MYCFFLSYYLLFVVFVENGQKKRFNLIICLFAIFVENGGIRQLTKKTPPKRGLVLMCPIASR